MDLTLLLSIIFVIGMFLLAVGMSWPTPPYLARVGAWIMAVTGLIWLIAGHLR